MLAIMAYQDISPGFAVKKVGMALQTLGYQDKNFSYTTVYNPKSASDLQQAHDLIYGTLGTENLNHFWLALKLTCKRLSKYIADFFLLTLGPAISRDFEFSVGFFEQDPEKIEEVIKLVSQEGFSVPIARIDVNNPADPHAAWKLRLKFLALSKLYADFSGDLTD